MKIYKSSFFNELYGTKKMEAMHCNETDVVHLKLCFVKQIGEFNFATMHKVDNDASWSF